MSESERGTRDNADPRSLANPLYVQAVSTLLPTGDKVKAPVQDRCQGELASC